MSIKKINVESFPLNFSLHCVVIFSHVIILSYDGSVHRTFIHSTRVLYISLFAIKDESSCIETQSNDERCDECSVGRFYLTEI